MEMDFNILMTLLKFIIISTYSFICFISIIFTFFVERYRWLNEVLEFEIIPARTMTLLESTLVDVDDWLFTHHRIIGPVLFLASAFIVYMLNNAVREL